MSWPKPTTTNHGRRDQKRRDQKRRDQKRRDQKRRDQKGCERNGLSLLEVILALTILGMSMFVIGQLVHLGSRNAVATRELTTAQFLAQSKMAEVKSGILPLNSEGPSQFEPYETPDPWTYEITVEPLPDPALVSVTVRVAQEGPVNPVSFSLVTWMIDPTALEDEALLDDPTAGGAAPADAGAGGGGGGTGGGAGGT